MGCVYYYDGKPYESLGAIVNKLGGPPSTKYVGVTDTELVEEVEEPEIEIEEEAGPRAFKKDTLPGNFVDSYIKAIDDQIISIRRAMGTTTNQVAKDKLNNQQRTLIVQKKQLIEEATLRNLIYVGKRQLKRVEDDMYTPEIGLKQILDNLNFVQAWGNLYNVLDENDIPEASKTEVALMVAKANRLFARQVESLISKTKDALIKYDIDPKIAANIDKAYKDTDYSGQQFITTSFDSRPIAYAIDTLMHDASIDINQETMDFQKELDGWKKKMSGNTMSIFERDPKSNRLTPIKPHKSELYEEKAKLMDEIRMYDLERKNMVEELKDINKLIKKAQQDGDNARFTGLLYKKRELEMSIAKHKKETKSWLDYHEFMRDNFDFTPLKGSREAMLAEWEAWKAQEREEIAMVSSANGIDKYSQEMRLDRSIKSNDPVEFERWLKGEKGVTPNRGAKWFAITPKAKWKNPIYDALSGTQKEFYEWFTDKYLEAYKSLPSNEFLDSAHIDNLLMKFSMTDGEELSMLSKLSKGGKDWLKDLVMVSYAEDTIDRTTSGPLSGQTFHKLKFKSVSRFYLDSNGIFTEGSTLPEALQKQLQEGKLYWKDKILFRKSTDEAVPKFTQTESDPFNILEKFVSFAIDFKHKLAIEGVLLSLSEIASSVGTIKQTEDNRTKFDLYADKKKNTDTNYAQGRMKHTIDSFLYNKRKDAYSASEKLEPGKSAFSFAKLGDTVIDLTRARNMGLNPFSGMGNLLMGTINNSIMAASKQFFNEKDLAWAYYMLRGSTTKVFDISTLNNIESKKAAKILRRWDILGDFSDTLYRNDNLLSKALDELYVFQRRGEFLNQGAVMIAMMLNFKIKDKIGNERMMWELMDLDEENDTLKINPDFEGTEYANTRKLDRFFTGVQKVNKKIHGDYDPRNPLMYKKTVWGRALMQFRTWLPLAIKERFGGRDVDVQLSQVYGKTIETEGRWVTAKRVIWSSSESPMEKVKNISKILGSALWTTFSNKRLTLDTEISELDAANISMIVKEVWYAMMFSVTSAALLALKRMNSDDDDEKKDAMSFMNFLYNQTTRVESELWFLYSVTDMKKFVKDFVPAINTIEQAFKIQTAAKRYFYEPEADIYKSGFRKGSSKFWKEVQLFAPIAKQGQNIWSTGSQIFEDEPYPTR